jgi:hypothetical protein
LRAFIENHNILDPILASEVKHKSKTVVFKAPSLHLPGGWLSSTELIYRKVKVRALPINVRHWWWRAWDKESDMTSLILIVAFLFIPTFLSFLALKEMSQMQESELVVRDSSGGTVHET